MSLFPRLFAIIPFGIGVSLLFFLWSDPFGPFGSPPLFFRVFGSFIALAFVMVGIGIFVAAGRSGDPRRVAQSFRDMTSERTASQSVDGAATVELAEESRPKVGYDCPNCGAALGKAADVSPSGDVKCGYCERWFNIHSDG